MQSCFQGISPVSLRKLFPCAEMFGADDFTMLNAVSDVEKVQEGDVFFACNATNGMLDALLDDAIRRGAKALVVPEMTGNPFRMTPNEELVPLLVVEEVEAAYARACHALFGFPSRKLEMIGVTGTSGKTMTSCLIAGILGAARRNVGMLGSLGVFDGVDASPNSISLLPPKRTASWLARMIANGCSHAVVEVSSQALALSRLESVSFGTICVTNILRAHLEYHRSLCEYRKAKMRIFEYLSRDGVAILNADDPICAEAASWLDIPILTYGLHNSADVSGAIIEQGTSEQTLLVSAGDQTAPLRTRIVGNHYIYDCLAAIAVGLRLGIQFADVLKGVESVDLIPGRMERIDCGQNYSVFIDRAAAPEELRSTLEFLREVTRGRIYCVMSATPREGSGSRSAMELLAAKYADLVFLAEENRPDDSDGLNFECKSAVTQKVFRCESRRDAILHALSTAKKGDSVLIAGRGYEKKRAPNDPARQDDRDIVRRILFRIP
ncbi:MAG: UDP-N-acetylmuramyl-tripeptide synthetase [Planctomycetia bacterium]|nr:UDP-N-acetylmuramyl-tripeptide synthetase [Planctomycetia bacterium]